MATLPDRSSATLEAVAIHTFSNGTEWECWASGNCLTCRWWDEHACGALCAFEGAAFLHFVTPDLARMFGWTHARTEYGPLSGWEAPYRCAFHWQRRDDDDYSEDPVPTCPETLNLFTDQRSANGLAVPSMATTRRSTAKEPQP